jgi:hypothetical protein
MSSRMWKVREERGILIVGGYRAEGTWRRSGGMSREEMVGWMRVRWNVGMLYRGHCRPRRRGVHNTRSVSVFVDRVVVGLEDANSSQRCQSTFRFSGCAVPKLRDNLSSLKPMALHENE